MKLPNANQARVDESKVTDYLLSVSHQDGSAKARFFERFGFRASNCSGFILAILEHGRVNPVANVVDNEFGKRYSVDGEIRSPDGRNPTIRTVWIIEAGLDIPRLITAYPLEEPK